MTFERLTWAGFMIVAAGWALMFSAPQLTGLSAHMSGHAAEASTLDFPMVAQSVVLSGFGVGIIGVLQTGFSALNRFFEAVLARSQQDRAPRPAGAPHFAGPSAPAPARAAAPGPASAPPRAVERRQPTLAKKIVERGWVKDRAYVLFADGSVEVETMLGRRMFPSLQEAQEFIA